MLFHYLGSYDSPESLKAFNEKLTAIEQELSNTDKDSGANRLFYLAIPPSIFTSSCKSIRQGGKSLLTIIIEVQTR